MPNGYTLKDVNDFFRVRLQEEAKKIFVTGSLTAIYEAALAKVPDVRFTLVGGARAYPRLGRVGDYKKFLEENRLRVGAVKSDVESTTIQQQDPLEQLLDAEAYRTRESEILKLFSNQHTHSDYDLAAVVVNDDVRHEEDVVPRLMDQIKAVCQEASLRPAFQELESSLGVTIQDLLDKDKLKRIYDVREGFVFREKDFLDILKTYPQIWEVFRSDEKDVLDLTISKGEGNVATVKIKPPTRIELRVANVRRENGALVALIDPSNGPKPYLRETLDHGALVVGDIRAEVWNALKEIDGLQKRNPRIRRIPQGWKAFVEYARELEELDLLTNGLADSKAKYERLATST